MRARWLVMVMAASLTGPVRAAPAAGKKLDFGAFLSLVDQAHPEARISSLGLERAKQAESRAGLLGDPELQIGRQYLPLAPPSPDMPAGPTRPQWQLTATQAWPWPGQLAAEQDGARATFDRQDVEAKIESTRRHLAAAALYVDMVAAAKQIEVHRASLADSDSVLKSATARVRQGIGTHHELVAAQTEKTLHALNLRAMEADLQNLTEHAAQLAGQADSVQFAQSLTLEWPDAALRQEAPTADLARRRLELSSRAAGARLTSDALRSRPRLTTTGMLMRDDGGMPMAGFMLGFSVPLFSGPVRASTAEESTLLAAENDQSLGWQAQTQQLARTQNARRLQVVEQMLTTLHQEIVPSAQQHLQTILTDYALGREAFAGVDAARAQILQLELAEVDMHRQLAQVLITKAKIDIGLADEGVDLPTPQIGALAVGGARMAPAMGGMPGGGGAAAAARRRAPGNRPTPDTSDSPEPADRRGGGMGGM